MDDGGCQFEPIASGRYFQQHSVMTPTTLRIRQAVRGDIPGLLDLYRYLIPGDERASDADASDVFDRFLAYTGSAIFLGGAAGLLVASCTPVVVPNLTRAASPYGLIENVVTHCDHRQRGFGRQILNAASEAAWAAGCYKVMLLTGSKKAETLNFYLSAGFEQSKTGFQKRCIPVKLEG
jgi:N-acetylglutamate synthase-like GNAT family acetyltransferase